MNIDRHHLNDRDEYFNERAAIYEYLSGLPRAEAERRAREDTDRVFRDRVTS